MQHMISQNSFSNRINLFDTKGFVKRTTYYKRTQKNGSREMNKRISSLKVNIFFFYLILLKKKNPMI